eukprot:Platyproteum_vivax@DN4611_c0_g1_i1.p1
MKTANWTCSLEVPKKLHKKSDTATTDKRHTEDVATDKRHTEDEEHDIEIAPPTQSVVDTQLEQNDSNNTKNDLPSNQTDKPMQINLENTDTEMEEQDPSPVFGTPINPTPLKELCPLPKGKKEKKETEFVVVARQAAARRAKAKSLPAPKYTDEVDMEGELVVANGSADGKEGTAEDKTPQEGKPAETALVENNDLDGLEKLLETSRNQLSNCRRNHAIDGGPQEHPTQEQAIQEMATQEMATQEMATQEMATQE